MVQALGLTYRAFRFGVSMFWVGRTAIHCVICCLIMSGDIKFLNGNPGNWITLLHLYMLLAVLFWVAKGFTTFEHGT